MTRINEIVQKFVTDLTSVIETSAQETLKDKLGEFLGNSVTSLPKAKSSLNKTRPGYARKPCPVPDCPELAAPRFHMVCKNHKDLPREKIAEFTGRAKIPGGVWYKTKVKAKKTASAA